jgi:hypothetical protein
MHRAHPSVDSEWCARALSCPTAADFFRHDNLLGRVCFACPEGGKCEVRRSTHMYTEKG